MSNTRAPITIILGGRDFKIRPVTIGQVCEIDEAVQQGAPDITTARRIVAAALSRDYKDVDTGELEVTVGELSLASSQIIAHAGYFEKPPAKADEQAA